MGSGASAGSTSDLEESAKPPTWLELLTLIKNHLSKKEDLPIVNDLLSKDKYLDAAEILLKEVSQPDIDRILREKLVTPHFKPSRIHKAVLQIDPKIVITTNYDDIYEIFCNSSADAHDGYRTCTYYDTNIAATLKSPVRMIIKAHGCIKQPDKIVLTRSQYFKARKENSNFYRILDALFLTNTLFFIGYNLSDPDIQLVLENVNIVAESNYPHYAYMPTNIHKAIKNAIKTAYNIDIIEYSQGDYEELYRNFELLLEQVLAYRETYCI